VPVLALVSTRTWPHGEAWSACAAELGLSGVPRLDPVCVEGTGHFLMLDKPDEVARRIASFADWNWRHSRPAAATASTQ
jgi:pimeloyl-ACP methyl ester carboxylesterase